MIPGAFAAMNRIRGPAHMPAPGMLGGLPAPDFLWDFTTASLAAVIGTGTFTVTRASSAWVRDPTTGLITAIGNNVPAFNKNFLDGVVRLRSDEAKTQYLGVTGTPATQTTSSLGTGAYVLWIEGSGSATVSAGTATITGAGAAVEGTPKQFTVTGAGTVVVTVAGSVTWFQLENGNCPTGYIVNAGAPGTTVVRAADVTVLNPFTLTTPCTIVARGMMQAIDGTLDATIRNLFTISDGTNNERYSVQHTASSQIVTPVIIDGGASQLAGLSRNLGANVRVACAFTVATNDVAASVTGQDVQTDSVVTLPTVNRIALGTNAAGSAQWWNAGIESIWIWNRLLQKNLLQRLAKIP